MSTLPATVGRDRGLLYVATFVRAVATGLLGVVLGLELAARGLRASEIGLVVGAGLAGAAVAALVVTLVGDRLGRRRLLLALTALAACGATIASATTSLPLLVAASFVGMLNGMGRDRGAALVLEQAMLPATTTDVGRTRAFAWYNVLQDMGHALGGLTAAVVGGAALPVYVGLVVVGGLPYVVLSPALEPAAPREPTHLSPAGRRVLWRISALFFLDSVAGGFIPSALLSVFFHERFGVGAGTLGVLFFAARAANAASHLVAAWLARWIGLVNTMVFTHIPSSLLLATVPFAPTFPVAAALFLVRESLVEMDVPTRQSYVMAVVRPEERTIAAGVTHLVRLAGWAVGPLLAGAAMERVDAATPLVVAAILKIAYDVLLYAAFRRECPPEERPAG